MGDGGKGSKQRPIENQQAFDDSWERIFGKKKKGIDEDICPAGLSSEAEHEHNTSGSCGEVCSGEET